MVISYGYFGITVGITVEAGVRTAVVLPDVFALATAAGGALTGVFFQSRKNGILINRQRNSVFGYLNFSEKIGDISLDFDTKIIHQEVVMVCQTDYQLVVDAAVMLYTKC